MDRFEIARFPAATGDISACPGGSPSVFFASLHSVLRYRHETSQKLRFFSGETLRYACIAFLGVWGGINLCHAVGRRTAPTVRGERMTLGLSDLALALALLAFRCKAPIPGWLLLVGGLCGVCCWLRSVYRQSLHNTTM